jgi:hypothetical protein
MRVLVVPAVLLAIVTAAATPASARPLPKGMKVVVVKDRPMVKQGALTVPLFDGERRGTGRKIKASLSADGKTVRVSWDGCMELEEYEVPLAHVTARLDNLAGMKLHLAKKYAAAIKPFAAAAAADPDEAMYVTNLLSAQARAGKLDDADRTLTTLGPRHRARVVWRLAVDPDLETLRTRPAALALAAEKPGTARMAALAGAAAFSALGGGMVATRSNAGNGGPGSPTGEDLLIFDIAGDRELLRFPVVTMADACIPDGGGDASSEEEDDGEDYEEGDGELRCTPAQLAAIAKRTKTADALLAALGFAVLPGAMVDLPTDDEATLSSPDRKTRVTVAADTLTIARGGKRFTVDRDQRNDYLIFAGDQVLLEYSETHLEYCDDDSFRTSLTLARPSTP